MSPLSIVKETLNRISGTNKKHNNPMKEFSFCMILEMEKNFFAFRATDCFQFDLGFLSCVPCDNNLKNIFNKRCHNIMPFLKLK